MRTKEMWRNQLTRQSCTINVDSKIAATKIKLRGFIQAMHHGAGHVTKRLRDLGTSGRHLSPAKALIAVFDSGKTITGAKAEIQTFGRRIVAHFRCIAGQNARL